MTPQQKRAELAFGIRSLKPKTEVYVQRECLEVALLPIPVGAKKNVAFKAEELDRLIAEANEADQKAADQAAAESQASSEASQASSEASQASSEAAEPEAYAAYEAEPEN